jgi:hypothetical protein
MEEIRGTDHVKNKKVLHCVMEDRDVINEKKVGGGGGGKGHISLRTTSETRYLRKDRGNGEMKKKM